ncbi:hypothetical protein BCY86_06500 [Pajaroellobacter abortibovis]|uniref:Uncharacterized protein n=1 Tax=Pajaroellobacter abortibovis TaxID=1882918 RepID=A0A1L6MY34_9BACT|nr:hypothetical protein BCY86_06500 [Pajaroellobacter abortibovis]
MSRRSKQRSRRVTCLGIDWNPAFLPPGGEDAAQKRLQCFLDEAYLSMQFIAIGWIYLIQANFPQI